jgi:hypothetical protein
VSRQSRSFISLSATFVGVVIFVASVIWRAYPLVLPAAGVTLILAIVGIIFGHRALASALTEKSSLTLPVICLVLSYSVALFIVVWLVALILAIRNFT